MKSNTTNTPQRIYAVFDSDGDISGAFHQRKLAKQFTVTGDKIVTYDLAVRKPAAKTPAKRTSRSKGTTASTT